MLGFPFPGGYAFCVGGNHIAALGDLTKLEGGRYCSTHMPEPEPDPVPLPALDPVATDHEVVILAELGLRSFGLTPRQLRRLDFMDWRRACGAFDDDIGAQVELGPPIPEVRRVG